MENLIKYAESLGNNQEIIAWLNTAGAKAVKSGKTSCSELEHVIDWLYSSDAPTRLKKMSVVDAKRISSKWMERNKLKGKNLLDSRKDITNFMKFKDGSKIVKLLSKNALEREGFLMSHCLGGYSVRDGYDIYSLRDKNNYPHATFEVAVKDGSFLQIKGKGNGTIHPKYIDRVLGFLKKLGNEVRISEMINLGYYHVPSIHLDLVRQRITTEKLVCVNNEYYVV